MHDGVGQGSVLKIKGKEKVLAQARFFRFCAAGVLRSPHVVRSGGPIWQNF